MSISQYQENGVTYWKVYVHIRSRHNRSRRKQKTIKGLKSEKEAVREEKKLIKQLSIEMEKVDGIGLDWKDVIDLWWTEVHSGYIGNVTPRSANEYLSIANKWTKAWFKKPASKITKADGRELITHMKMSDLSMRYQKKIKNLISSIFEWGIENRYIIGVTQSPLKGLLIEKTEERPPDILSLEEIKRFLTAAKALNHEWYPIWTFAILTGMRSGELHALQWKQIDLEKRTILVDKSYDANTRSVGPTKSRYWRTIPINESLYKLILNSREVKGSNFDPNSHVLPRINMWDYGDQAIPLKNFLKSIGLKVIKFHALRACFATQMLSNGVSAPIVMKIGGWKNTSTMDIYLRLAGVDTKGATDCLEFVPNEISFNTSFEQSFA